MPENNVNLYNEFNENTHKDLLIGRKCDICSKPATHWYGRNSRRLCDDTSCRLVCDVERAKMDRNYRNREDDY
ncbi:MAG: hypothetical protein WC679_01730 [Bacteroidales bacterium]|jgi:hypothetical protein